MNDDFKKFKRKIIAHTIIESAVYGIVAGLIVVAAMLLPLTLTEVTVNVGIYIVAGVGIFLIVGALTFFLQFPTDKRIALRLDNELSLNEKVQTMVAFRRSEEPMAVIQRADASSRLSAAGTKTIKFKKAWQCSVASVVAVGLFAGALSVAILNTDYEPADAVSDWTLVRLRNLISTVESSSLDEEPKTITLNELNNILDAVYDEETQTATLLTHSERVELVTGAIVRIDSAIDAVISAEVIGTSLYEMSADEILSEMGIHMRALSSGTCYSSFQTLSNVFTDENFETSADVATSLSTYSSRIIISLSASKISQDDVLYSYLSGLADELAEAATLTSADGDVKSLMLETASNAILSYAVSVRSEVLSQYSDRQLGLSVIYELQDIFEISDDEMPDIGEVYEDVIPGSSNNSSSDDDSDGSSSGGAGKGESLYGSDSLIYDYRTGEQVEYGEVFDTYNSIIMSLINEGAIDEKYVDMITQYLQALLSVNND